MAIAMESSRSPRISKQLVRSHLLVAAIGGGALILAFIAILILHDELEELAQKQVPIDRAAVQLKSGVEESLAAIRGWVSVKNPLFVEQWKNAWSLSIRPAYKQLKSTEQSIASAYNERALQRLDLLLNDLEESQWWVRSVAQVPGNKPAELLYQNQIKPIAERIASILENIQYLVQRQSSSLPSDLPDKMRALSRDFNTIWREIEMLVNHGQISMPQTYRYSINKFRIRLQIIDGKFSTSIRKQLDLLAGEFRAFVVLAEEALRLRQLASRNRAQNLMETQTIPIAEQVTDIVQMLSISAKSQMSEQVREAEESVTLYVWAMLIIMAMVALAAVLIARRRSQKFAKPIAELATAVQALARGNMNVAVEATGSYELESLGDYFKQMRKQLYMSRLALKEANEQLEERVKIRTRELQEAKDHLQENEERLRLAASVFKHSLEGVVITDPHGIIVDVNRAFSDILGYCAEEAIGKNPRFWIFGSHDKDFFKNMWRSLSETGQWRGEFWSRRKDGSIFPVWLNVNNVRNNNGQVTHYIGLFSDITNIKQSQEKLDHLAHHDPLTDLPNRLLLLERLTHAISRAERQKIHLAVIFFDLDRFKQINDNLGHSHGDLLLQLVSKRLSQTIRSDDTLARIGGDEFILLLEGVKKTEAVAHTAQKMLLLFEKTFNLEGHEVTISASLGVAIYPEDGNDPTSLLRNADAAMYRAKKTGRNNYQFYTQDVTQNTLRRLAMENSLRGALDRNELYLLYQPQVDMRSKRVVGVECLLRWQSEKFGLVYPTQFIPIAEESGLIHGIGKWVLNEVCWRGKQWLDDGYDIGRVSVNISKIQLNRGNLLEEVTQALKHSVLPPEFLELEVTEDFIMEDPEYAISQLSSLHDIGVVLSIDDFGAGYSSLSHLKRLPVDRLKIDRSFVRDISETANNMLIIDAVIAIGRSMAVSVIAEGVETAGQAEFLTTHGCIEGQGYLFSKPVISNDYENQFLKKGGL